MKLRFEKQHNHGFLTVQGDLSGKFGLVLAAGVRKTLATEIATLFLDLGQVTLTVKDFVLPLQEMRVAAAEANKHVVIISPMKEIADVKSRLEALRLLDSQSGLLEISLKQLDVQEVWLRARKVALEKTLENHAQAMMAKAEAQAVRKMHSDVRSRLRSIQRTWKYLQKHGVRQNGAESSSVPGALSPSAPLDPIVETILVSCGY